MKWLPKEKRNPFFLVVFITVGLLLLIYFGLLNSQNSVLARVRGARNASETQLAGMEKAIKTAAQATNELAAASTALAKAEQDMASGDLYSWAANTLRFFKQQYKIEISEISHPVDGEVDLLPSFPYRQMRFMVTGKGYYHDIGKFVSGFENEFPHTRAANLTIEPAGGEGEKLSFRMEIIALINPNPSSTP